MTDTRCCLFWQDPDRFVEVANSFCDFIRCNLQAQAKIDVIDDTSAKKSVLTRTLGNLSSQSYDKVNHCSTFCSLGLELDHAPVKVQGLLSNANHVSGVFAEA